MHLHSFAIKSWYLVWMQEQPVSNAFEQCFNTHNSYIQASKIAHRSGIKMDIVKKLKDLAHTSAEAEDWLHKHLEVFEFKKNEPVIKAGQVCRHLYFIRKGMAGAWYLSDGREVCNWIAAENDFATSYYSFISQQPSYEQIECFEPCRMEAIHYEKLQELYKLFPETERAGRLILEEYYFRLEERLISIQFRSAKERLDHFAKSRGHILHRAPLGRIASYLGMQQETLSRLRAQK